MFHTSCTQECTWSSRIGNQLLSKYYVWQDLQTDFILLLSTALYTTDICDLSRTNVPYAIRSNDWTHGKQTDKKRMQIFFERQGQAAERKQIFFER